MVLSRKTNLDLAIFIFKQSNGHLNRRLLNQKFKNLLAHFKGNKRRKVCSLQLQNFLAVHYSSLKIYLVQKLS